MKKLLISAVGLLVCFSAVSFSQTLTKVTRAGNLVFRNHKINTGLQMLQKETDLFSVDTLPRLKEDFMVNDLGGDYGAEQGKVYAAADSSGNLGLVWLDYRNGKKDIYAQFYTNDQKAGSNFKVNEDPILGNNTPFIAVNKKGDFVITWLKNFNEVMAQRFTSSGQKLGSNLTVSSSWGTNTMEPSVAVNNDGSFLVTWASETGNSVYMLYARLFDASGNPAGGEIVVSEPDKGVTSIGQGKRIAVDNKGTFCVAWSSAGGSNFSNIYLQLVNSSGQKIGINSLVSVPGDSADSYFPEIASTDDGYFFIIWYKDFRSKIQSGLNARIFRSDNIFVTSALTISSPDSWGDSYTVTSDKKSTFIIAYSGINPFSFQKIDKSGKYIGNTVRVKYNNVPSGYHYSDQLTDVYNDHFYSSNTIYQKGDPDIFLQKFSFDLSPINDGIKVNDDEGSASQQKPLVHFNDQGQAIVLWQDRRNGWKDLYAQVYDKDFIPIGGNIQINDPHTGYWFLDYKDVRNLSDGSFIIAFSGDDSLGNGIYLQNISSTGEKAGNSILIKKDYYSSKVVLSVNKQDQILLCWYDNYYAYLRKFSSRLIPLNEEKNFIKDLSRKAQFSLSVDPEFNIFTAWSDYNVETESYEDKIFGLFYNENGNQEGSSFIIMDNFSYNYLGSFFISNDKKDFIIIWADYSKFYVERFYSADFYSILNSFRTYSYDYTFNPGIINFENRKALIKMNDGLNVYGYFFNDNKERVDSFILHSYNFLNPEYDYYYNAYNSVDLFENKLAFAYENTTFQSTGLDIWVNLQEADKINFNKEGYIRPANYDVLYTNYPNPFNSTTKIPYQLFAFHKVRLSVFDILGREVKVLVDQYQEKGIYEINFDASGLPSGIYFCRLQAFDTSVKKMIHIK